MIDFKEISICGDSYVVEYLIFCSRESDIF